MSELLAVLGALAASLTCTGAIFWLGSFDLREKGLLTASYVGHVVCSFVMIWLTKAAWGGGDMFTYHEVAREVTYYLRVDFTETYPEVLNLLFQRETILPVWVFGNGTSTGSMIALTAFLGYVLDDSLHAICLTIATISFIGKLALYLAAREALDPIYRFRLIVAIMLLPSVVFWSAGILKEPLAIAGIGFLTLAVQRFWDSRWLMALALGALGFLLVASTKAYFLFVFVVALGVWRYWRRAAASEEMRVRPIDLLLGATLAVGGLIILGQLFPRFSVTNLAEEVALLQTIGRTVTGGSSYEIGDPAATTFGGQVAFAPIALLYAFFRPFIFEAHNVPMAMSGLEATILTFAFLRLLWIRPWADTWRILVGTPFLVYAIVFSIGVAVAVGLSTTNLGTLVRYRMPMLPFFGTVLLVLGADLPARAEPREGVDRQLTPWGARLHAGPSNG